MESLESEDYCEEYFTVNIVSIFFFQNIVKSLNSKNISCNSIVVDNFLWNYRRSHADEIDAKIPMHRTRCIYY